MLFTLYKTLDIPELSSISEMIYLLPKESVLALCEYYGGMTIRIPTLDELEILLHTIKLYKDVDIDKKDKSESIENMGISGRKKSCVLQEYEKVVRILNEYQFKQRV